MGWFDDQIKERKKRDSDNFADAMDEISSVITRKKMGMGNRNTEAARQSQAEDAIRRILEFYRVKPRELPDNVRELPDQLEYLCRPHGIMRRTVCLDEDWYTNAVGAYLGSKKDGTRVALVPNRFSGYSYYDPETGKRVKLNARTAAQLEKEAICFYKTFPLKQLSMKDVLRFTLESLPPKSYFFAILILLITTMVGMFSPRITHIIFNDVVYSGSMRLFWSVVVFSVCVSISSQMIGIVKMLMDERITTQVSVSVQAATMARILALPVDFFKKYSAGELSTKVQYLNSLCATLYSGFAAIGLSSLFSLMYIGQIFQYAPALLVPSLCVTAATLLYTLFSTRVRSKVNGKSMESAGKKNGLTYALITGIQKIRQSGSESRAFTQWTKSYTEEVRNTYGIPVSVLLSGTVGMAISLTGSLILYYTAVRENIPVADYYAFTAAYGVVSGAFSALLGIGLKAANIRPTLEQIAPILEAVPEVSTDRKLVGKLRGRIELNHVSFRYAESMPWVLDDLSLTITPGQYVAIVGRTGCGKSTLMRLLLGFETPQKGTVFYDGNNIETLDLKSLRQKIGVVLQNGKLFCGDIFSNIAISAPWLSLKDVWQAAEFADIADDIRAMPMGMHTIVSEGSGGISGGQKQRLMIARALAPKPKILMFDEATSALDNITQKKISQSLDKLKCTRIVIAHRLSTIRHCDRILVLDGGKIVEDGSYDELLAQGGFFAELVKRQCLDLDQSGPDPD